MTRRHLNVIGDDRPERPVQEIVGSLRALDARPSKPPEFSEDYPDGGIPIIRLTPDRPGGFRFDGAMTAFVAVAEFLAMAEKHGTGIRDVLPNSVGAGANETRPRWKCSACSAEWFTVQRPEGDSPCGLGFRCSFGPGTAKGKAKRFARL